MIIETISLLQKKLLKDVYSTAMEISNRSKEYVASFIIHSIFDTYIMPILNSAIPEEINLELEKVMIPFIICSKKEIYCLSTFRR